MVKRGEIGDKEFLAEFAPRPPVMKAYLKVLAETEVVIKAGWWGSHRSHIQPLVYTHVCSATLDKRLCLQAVLFPQPSNIPFPSIRL